MRIVLICLFCCAPLYFGLMKFSEMNDAAAAKETAARQARKDQAAAAGVSLYLETVEHDGHRFILTTTSHYQQSRSILHHPDCPCLKEP